jgi:hypothetical protein
MVGMLETSAKVVTLVEEPEVMAIQITAFTAPMAAQEVWRYSAVLLMERLVSIAVTEETAVLR